MNFILAVSSNGIKVRACYILYTMGDEKQHSCIIYTKLEGGLSLYTKGVYIRDLYRVALK